MIGPVAELEACLSRLPGFGRRSAARAAQALVRERLRLAAPLSDALAAVMENVRCCSRCGAFTIASEDPCALCTDPRRDSAHLCVVEEPDDIARIEATGAFRGRYHVLGGKLAPSRRMGPEKLRIAELADRVVREGASEVLLALSTDMEGDATALYVAERLRGTGAKITRLALGLPADSGVGYSDPLTLRRAIVNRTEQ